ncbi:hypothetical protein ACKGJO_00895 [Gracilimonas sp. Q87]|uniref:hypothetical protein n=1 Tax=Gracilimonas sp. Q87 TaxID=3384766 RepID=UPI00398407E2
MQITKLLQTSSFNSLIAVILVAMVLIFFNDPDPDLEKRVTKIEESLSNKDAVQNNENRTQNRENWRQLREGMSQDKVEELLGPPQHIEGGSISIWRYTNGGSVTFMDGKVNSWSEPL